VKVYSAEKEELQVVNDKAVKATEDARVRHLLH